MKKSEIEIGGVYIAKVSGRLCRVRVIGHSFAGPGWNAVNEETNRIIRVRGCQRFRRRVLL